MRRDELAVGDVLGSILLVGITITSFTALSLFVANIPPPPDALNAEVAISIRAGPDGSWGTGDEYVEVRHLYGESLPEDGTAFVLSVSGVVQKFKDSQLGFSGNSFDIGETWQHTSVFSFNDVITVGIVVQHGGGSKMMATTTAVTGETLCSTDNDPPHAIIVQEPGNLEALTGTTPVVITALLLDICSNVDPLSQPVLEYWFNNEPHSSIVMSPTGGDEWAANVTIPGGWATKTGQNFHYAVTQMVDDYGNMGNSAVQTDFIEPIPPTYHYVANHTIVLGTLDDFPAMQNASDGAQFAKLGEGVTGSGQSTLTLYGQSLSTILPDTNDHWNHEDDVLGNADDEAEFKENWDPSTSPLRIEFQDPAPSSDQVISLKIAVTGRVGDLNDPLEHNDGWRLQACWTGTYITGSTCSQKSNVLTAPIPTVQSTIMYDITNKRPGGGAWHWDDLANIDILAGGQIVNGIRDSDEWLARDVRLIVEHGPGFDLEQEFTWDNPIILNPGLLQMRYYTNNGEFDVEVYDWIAGGWNARASKPLNAITSTLWSDTVTSNEWNNGDPRIRIVSQQTNPSSQAHVYFDFIRVTE